MIQSGLFRNLEKEARFVKSFTFWLTLLSILLCVYNYVGTDPDGIALLLFSPATWVIPLFTDINDVSVFLLYALTILVWFYIGFWVDRMIEKSRTRTAS